MFFLLSSEGPCECSLTDSLSVVSEEPSQVVALLLSPVADSVVRADEAEVSLVGVEGSLSLSPTFPSCKTLLGVS